MDIIRAELIENTPCAANDRRLLESLCLPPNFGKLTPSDKTNAIALCGAPSHISTEFMDNRAKLNVIRSVNGSLRPVADGASTYIRFCKMAENRPSRPSSGIIRKWSSSFNPGQAFGHYINRARNVSTLLNFDDGWITPESRLISAGLSNGQGRSFASPNFARSVDLFETIDCEALQSTFGMIDYLSYLPRIRVPPEKLKLRASFAPSKLMKFTPQKDKALIAPVGYEGNPI